MCLFQKGRPEYKQWIFGDPVAKQAGTPHRVRVIISEWSPSSLGFLRGGCGAYGDLVFALGRVTAQSV
jgi:hypothetical protein